MAAAGFGAVVGPDGVRFTLWAPTAQTARAEVERPAGAPLVIPLARGRGGLFEARTSDAAAGDRYRLHIDDQPAWPDPASRFQPDGVHGPSEIVDPSAFAWSDSAWTGLAVEDLIVYELHVGTFSEAGTFQGVIDRLPELARLGVTAIELMPVAAFPGRRNWGYDGGALYAPSATYGRPDDLRRLVDAAHGLDLAVLLDVVYNHLGPDGAYLAAFAPTIFAAHDSPWGGGLDFVDPDSRLREFFADNAAHWIREYHIDGLRLDATHAIHDEPAASFPGQVARTAWAAAPDRIVLVIAEDSRNLDLIVRRPDEGGQGLDAVWADDFHHQVRRHVAGDRDGYYADFGGTPPDVVETMRRGWFYCGQQARFFGGPRGTDPSGIPLERFVICIQNHDQVGNRAMGERLHHQIDPDVYLAASVLLMLAPETPLLFMGQEWAASSPFQFFTDHDEPLGHQVTEGRRREFAAFEAFADPAARERIPDPQDPQTFERSRLNWQERADDPHARVLRLYREALALRRRMREAGARTVDVRAADAGAVVLRHVDAGGEPRFITAVRLSGTGKLPVEGLDGEWKTVLTTDPIGGGRVFRPGMSAGPEGPACVRTPGAVVFERVDGGRS